MSGGAWRRGESFQPVKILSQIFVLQVLHVLSFLLLAFAGCAVFGDHFTLFSALSADRFDAFSGAGFSVIIAHLFAALFSAWCVSAVVGRLRRAVDFCFTLYFIFVLMTWIYAGFPLSAAWWLVILTCFVIMAAVAEYLCIRREMQDISVVDLKKSTYLDCHYSTSRYSNHHKSV
jgi:hypothetical protein